MQELEHERNVAAVELTWCLYSVPSSISRPMPTLCSANSWYQVHQAHRVSMNATTSSTLYPHDA